jgi:type IV pilus assembly protein PilA
MADLIRKRLTGKIGESEGFTLIELLVVIVILGVLMAIAVPAYMGFKDRANRSAAQANVRSALATVEAYYQDNNTYAGMTLDALKSIDAGIKLDSTMSALSDTTYCVQATAPNTSITYHSDQTHTITSGPCP